MKTDVAELDDFAAGPEGEETCATASAGDVKASATAIAIIERKVRCILMAASELPQPLALAGEEIPVAAPRL